MDLNGNMGYSEDLKCKSTPTMDHADPWGPPVGLLGKATPRFHSCQRNADEKSGEPHHGHGFAASAGNSSAAAAGG